MKKRFSSQELFELRNAIPIDRLIKDQLQIPSKVSEGVFRFLCPVCREFNTAVKPATNLARCFCCLKNFNTIDLVMEVRKTEFTESVLFLKTVLAQIHGQGGTDVLQDMARAPGRAVQTESKACTKPFRDKSRGLETVRQIFQRMFLEGENRS